MDWDQHYIDECTPWDKGAPAPPLLEWLETNPDRVSGRVLVPGVGRGHDAAAIASHRPEAHVVGIDISPNAVNAARKRYENHNLRFAVDDLFSLSPPRSGPYDWVWEHTCFCAIDPHLRSDYVKAVHDALAEEGFLLAVFYLDPYDEEHRPGGGPPHGSTLDELEDRFVRKGKFEIVESYTPARSYEGRQGLEETILFRKLG